MPTIDCRNSSPLKEILAVKSERSGGARGSEGDCTFGKRRLTFDAAAGQDSPISTPTKLKSLRGCRNSSPNSPSDGSKEDSGKRLPSLCKSPVKRLHDSFDRKQNWNPSDPGQMSAVKEALHVSTAPQTVVCREDEQKRILEFCKTCLEQEKAGSLYICGCPGTGKSLSMDKVKQQVVDWARDEGLQAPDVITINCTSLTNTTEIFSKIADKHQQKKKTSPLQHLRDIYSQKQQSSGSKMMVIIADELDYLITRDRAVLHDLFMLTTFQFSRCILIGIANAIDLADRFLPRLQSLNCKPLVVTFRAYSKDQILRILRERLMALPYVVFQPQALELCARKVAAASGDMRKALSVCRSAVEMLEADMSELSSSLNSSVGEATDKQTPPDLEVFKRQQNITVTFQVRIDHMAAALSKTFRSPVVDTIQSLPQHQQIILCSAAKFSRGKKKDATIEELNKSYIGVCKSAQIPPVGILEFLSMCRALSDQGLFKLVGQSRDDKLKSVTLKVDGSDITFALQGVRFFRNCLQ
ncbi:hypothetical protein SLA2020_022690 [Shorea laevis]